MKIGPKEVRGIPNLPYPWRSWCPGLCGSTPWGWSWSGLCCHLPQADPYGAVSVGEPIGVSSEKIREQMGWHVCGTSRWHGGGGHWVGWQEGERGEGRGLGKGGWRSCASVAGSDCLSACNKRLRLSDSLELGMLDFKRFDDRQWNSHVGIHRFESVLWYETTCECKGIQWRHFIQICPSTYIFFLFHNCNVIYVWSLTSKRPHRLVKLAILILQWRNRRTGWAPATIIQSSP